MSLARATATRASRGLPFGAFASLLPPEPSDDRLVRGEHGELLRRYVRAVVEVAGGRPLVVFVDDAHLLDRGSATLVHQLALTRAATVVATVRSGEVAPDPVVALWKDGPAEASTPPVATITVRVHLTPGELDAALQAAAGRSNKQIAADMRLSVRTVESHLQRVYEKLGVSGRRELTEALRDRPTT